MSHRLSQAARHTQELLQDLERDKELDVLRVYLTRYNLFPRKRDPKTAPIRAEELRDLVKHWKLHRQRNFWKSHATKEELVRTLYKHINTKVRPSEAPTSAVSPSSSSSSVLPARPPTPNPSEIKKAPFDRRITHRGISMSMAAFTSKLSPRNGNYTIDGYHGDLFSQRGDYDDGMIYLSRMTTSSETRETAPDTSTTATTTPSINTASATNSVQPCGTPSTPRNPAETPTDTRIEVADEDATTREVRMKQECACSLYQLALQEGHEAGMVLEGCVPALVRLSLFDDNDVKKYCAAALVNLTCDGALLPRMLEEGLLGGLMELSKLQHEDVRRNAAIGLCRGSYERMGQLRLLQEGSVPAMISMLNSTDFDTKEACLKALINIASYAGATVSDTVTHTIVKMTARKDTPSLHFVAQAMANLSVLTGPRVKAVEDGLLEPLTEVCHAGASIDVKRLVAMALCNFSGVETNYGYLSQLPILRVLDILLETPDERIRELSSTTVANLTCRLDAQRQRISSVLAMRLIQIGYMQNDVIQSNVSLALANVVESDRLLLTQHGVVPLVLRFLRDGTPLTQSHAVALLCGLMEHETSRAELLQCDAIDVVLHLTTTSAPSIREFCALSFFNFSAHADLAPFLLAPGTLATLLGLLKEPLQAKDEGKEPTILLSRVQELCLNCLYNLSFHAPSRPGLVAEGAIGLLCQVFRKPSKTLEPNKRCVALLCNVSFDDGSREQMLRDDVLKLLKRLTTNTTCKELLLCASSALCNLACPAMASPTTPILQMLMDLSQSPHAEISLNCAIAFAKLAATSMYTDVLSRCLELPPTLVVMMRSGIEEVQIHCATALCGLAAERGQRGVSCLRHLWKEGTISDFIVNSLLRINSDSTKEICAKVLFNVLTHDDCRLAMIKGGVLYALVKLARLESLEIRILCVTALYNLSCDASLLTVLLDINIGQVVAKMCESDVNNEETRQKLAACLANVTLDGGHEAALVQGDILNAVLLLCEHGSTLCRRFGASVLGALSMCLDVCDAMATLPLIELLLQMMCAEDGPQTLFSLSALCNLSCAASAHEKLQEAETIASVVGILQTSEESLVLLTGAKVLHNMSYHAKFHAAMLTAEVVPTLLHIVTTLSEDAGAANQLVHEGAVRILRCAAIRGNNPRTIELCVIALCRLSRGGHSGPQLVADGLFDVIASARVALVLRTLSTYLACIPALLHDARIVPILQTLTQKRERDTCRHVVMLLHNITASRNRALQAQAKAAGVIPLLIMLSQVGASDIRQVSSVALAHLNAELSDRDDHYDTGLVSTLISMLDMDPSTMHTVEKLAAAMPPPLKLQRQAPWSFHTGFRPTRVLLQLPVVWTLQVAPVDDARLVPPEPSALGLGPLGHQAAEILRSIQDTVHGQYTIMRVASDKCRLKPAPRTTPLAPAVVLQKLAEPVVQKLAEPVEVEKEPAVIRPVAPPPKPTKPTKPTPLVNHTSFNSAQRSRAIPHMLPKRGSAGHLNLPKL
ncbi:hypothetical protein SPRG_05937 [Saprolegnia parasitica CBS 223.65]|uniref:Vacuolar protein 8 n=1 Tax=Saprolegnia parasitica (strain CBS 223.65) TaxID=695850 RepID=A0A067CJM1_SAPPC|nr:hypothetical protein SPRG_05937 [Saprolegnia parasitica CBS 223.65]KDO29400.1 hypothetical protein SPRG_05937 [Saprolegnia parasitica CBS 223.65]|eukprot:XP_012199902.1 hypothetical protein SPRG_05937 [Saprolegnia parasitica CBS 223.65]